MQSVLIPASGSAVRMRGLPKFLLPSGVEDLTLVELHIKGIVSHSEGSELQT